MKAVHLLADAALVLALGFLSPAWAVTKTETQLSGETTVKLPNGQEVKVKAKKKIVKLKEASDPDGTPAKVVIFEVEGGLTIELTYASTDATTPTNVGLNITHPKRDSSQEDHNLGNAIKTLNKIYGILEKDKNATRKFDGPGVGYMVYFTVKPTSGVSNP